MPETLSATTEIKSEKAQVLIEAAQALLAQDDTGKRQLENLSLEELDEIDRNLKDVCYWLRRAVVASTDYDERLSMRAQDTLDWGIHC